MKKFLVLMLALGIAIVGFSSLSTAQAATSDTFQITVTVSYLSIELLDVGDADYTTWDVGTVETSSVSTMSGTAGTLGQQGIHVKNASSVPIDLGSQVTAQTTTWTFSSSAGDNTCALRAKSFTGWQSAEYPDMSTDTAVINNSTPVNVTPDGSSVPAAASRYLYYQLTTPSDFTTSSAENEIEVTITATKP